MAWTLRSSHFWHFPSFARGQYQRTAPARKIRNLSHFLDSLKSRINSDTGFFKIYLFFCSLFFLACSCRNKIKNTFIEKWLEHYVQATFGTFRLLLGGSTNVQHPLAKYEIYLTFSTVWNPVSIQIRDFLKFTYFFVLFFSWLALAEIKSKIHL